MCDGMHDCTGGGGIVGGGIGIGGVGWDRCPKNPTLSHVSKHSSRRRRQAAAGGGRSASAAGPPSGSGPEARSGDLEHSSTSCLADDVASSLLASSSRREERRLADDTPPSPELGITRHLNLQNLQATAATRYQRRVRYARVCTAECVPGTDHRSFLNNVHYKRRTTK